MLSYPITVRNNFCTQGQNTFHIQICTMTTFHSGFVWLATSGFGLFMESHVLGCSNLNAFQKQYMWSLDALQFLSAELSFSGCLIIKSLFQLLLANICKRCMHDASSATMSNWLKIQQVVIFGMLAKNSMHGAISSVRPIHTITNAEVQSCLERQVVLIMSHTMFLEVHPLLLKLHKKNTGQRMLRTLLSCKIIRYPHVDEHHVSRIPKYGHRFLVPHLLKHVFSIVYMCRNEFFVPGLVLIIFLLLARAFCSQK